MTSLRRLLILAALASPLLAAAPAAADTFTNSAPIAIPGTGSSGPASPYPSALRVTGMTGPVTDVNVTFHKTGHRFPREIRAVLVSPGGRAVTLMNANCGSDLIEDFTWIFDQQAAKAMPSDSCRDFVYRPNPSTNVLNMPAPAPPAPYGTSLDLFKSEDPNGVWKLFIVDTTAGDGGDMEGGWSLSVTTGPVDAVVPANGDAGASDPYPLTRDVAGRSGVIEDVDVRLDGVWHKRPEDLDMLLVGPQGQSGVLMSDACGTAPVSGADWTWDDEALGPMPEGNGMPVCGDGLYEPTDYSPGDSWLSPAPTPPFSAGLGAFDGTDPNGEWRLYAQDDEGDAAGFFTNRFELDIETRPPAPVAFAEGASTVSEGETAQLTLRRGASGGLGAATVNLTSVAGTAGPGSDYTPVSKTVAFAPGEAEKTVAVDALADASTERDETYAVAIGSPTGDAALGTPARAEITIPGDPAEAATCVGRRATIVGTDGRDVLRGTRRADVIVALGGGDAVRSARGNDTVCAGPGRDRVSGGPGRDRIFGEAAADRMTGGPARDFCHGGPGRDRARCERRRSA
jgi:subtilisin-like proprotein convertase family protein